jgi:hypothetical protein
VAAASLPLHAQVLTQALVLTQLAWEVVTVHCSQQQQQQRKRGRKLAVKAVSALWSRMRCCRLGMQRTLLAATLQQPRCTRLLWTSCKMLGLLWDLLLLLLLLQQQCHSQQQGQ